MFFFLVRHGGVAIIHQTCPRIENRFAFEVLAHHTRGKGFNGFDGGGGVFGDAVNAG